MKKVLTLTLAFAFIALSGFAVTGCSKDDENKIINPQTTPFEGTWKNDYNGNLLYKFAGSDVVWVESSNMSYKGTFEYTDTDITIHYTYYATGNAFTESVTWSSTTGTHGPHSYSFTGATNLVIDGFFSATKVS